MSLRCVVGGALRCLANSNLRRSATTGPGVAYQRISHMKERFRLGEFFLNISIINTFKRLIFILEEQLTLNIFFTCNMDVSGLLEH